ncbi:MAG TPA: NADP-dependent oxidoreductase [Thermoanaerobaculia bacterium]|nr:NADP-dependent oxidoreductase [Thermoanaerobaculia bacterium]
MFRVVTGVLPAGRSFVFTLGIFNLFADVTCEGGGSRDGPFLAGPVRGRIVLVKAVRVKRFGGPEVLELEDLPEPVPGPGQILVRVAAAGVGPWDALIREGRSAVPQRLPLTPGSDLSGTVERVGPGVKALAPGDEVFGVTNPLFTGAGAELAVAEAGMIARRPASIGLLEAAAVPVVAVTAWQMVFEHARLDGAQRVLVTGGAGNVGAYAVQLARRAGALVVATCRANDAERVRGLGAGDVVTDDAAPLPPVDAVLDTVGGDAVARAFGAVRPGGLVVSCAAPPDPARASRAGVRAFFFLVDVSTARLEEIRRLLENGLVPGRIGEVLPLAEVRRAHRMLAGELPHRPGKILLRVGA